MFTGIIQQTGRLARQEMCAGSLRLHIESKGWTPPLQPGESIAVNGVCLTVAQVTARGFGCDVLEETARCSNLNAKRGGDVLNLERALKLGEPLGGHLVAGHVEGLGTLISRSALGRDWRLDLACDSALRRYIVNKGSIACDGVSLTVSALEKAFFSVNVIPHTWQNTNLHLLKEGDTINLEPDLIGKYVFRWLEQGQKSVVSSQKPELRIPSSGGKAAGSITEEILRKAGFIG